MLGGANRIIGLVVVAGVDLIVVIIVVVVVGVGCHRCTVRLFGVASVG